MLLNEFLKEHRRVQELEATVAGLATTVKEQAAQIQKVSAELEASAWRMTGECAVASVTRTYSSNRADLTAVPRAVRWALRSALSSSATLTFIAVVSISGRLLIR